MTALAIVLALAIVGMVAAVMALAYRFADAVSDAAAQRIGREQAEFALDKVKQENTAQATQLERFKKAVDNACSDLGNGLAPDDVRGRLQRLYEAHRDSVSPAPVSVEPAPVAPEPARVLPSRAEPIDVLR